MYKKPLEIFRFQRNKINLLVLASFSFLYAMPQREAWPATIDCTTGSCTYSNSQITDDNIKIDGAGNTANFTASELSIINTTNNHAIWATNDAIVNILSSLNIDASSTGHSLYTNLGGSIIISGVTTITSTKASSSSILSSGENSKIKFNDDLNITSNGLNIHAELQGQIIINGNLNATNTGIALRNIYSQTGASIHITGNVIASGSGGGSVTNESVINAEGAGSTITIDGRATVQSGTGNNSSVVYANGGGILNIGSVDITDIATSTAQAGVLAYNNGTVKIEKSSIIRMQSGAGLQASLNSSITTGDVDIDILTSDNNETIAVRAEIGSNITVGAVDISISGSNDYGFNAKNNSSITANGLVNIGLSGGTTIGASTSAAIYAESSTITTNAGIKITTNGVGSDGIRLAASGKLYNTGALNIDIQGSPNGWQAGKCETGAAICLVGDGGEIFSTGGGIIKSTGHAIHFESGKNQNIDLTGVDISNSSNTLALINVQDTKSGSSSIKLTNSSATAGSNDSGLLLNAENGSILDFEAINTKLYGEIKADGTSTVNLSLKNSSYLKGIIDPINLNISSDSKWDVTGNSELDNLTNAGTVNFISSSSNSSQRIKVNSYSGGGSLGLNTYLNTGVGSSDILEILAGGSTTGKNHINILNKDGLGVLPPAIGVQVIEAPVAATQPDAFELTGDSVAAGIYEYTLYKNDNGNWYLSAHQTNNGQPGYNGSVSSVVSFASLAQLYNNLSLGTWNERVGDMAYADIQQIQAIQQTASPLWVRIEHERGEHDGGKRFQATSTTDVYSPQFKYRTSLLQVGADLLRKAMSDGAYQFAGISFTAGTIHADVDHFSGSNGNRRTRAGTAKINNYSLGGYWTYLTANRSYVDIVGQYTRHSLNGNGPAGSVSGNGHTLAASVEAGKAFALSNPNWTLVPQAQLRYQDVKLKHIAAKATTSVVGNYHFGDNDSLDLRLGLEARYKFTQQKTVAGKQGAWVRFDVLHEFKGKNTVQYAPVVGTDQPTFTSTRHGTSLNLEGGFAIPVSDTASIYSAAGYRRGLGSNKGHGWKAEVGMRWVY